MRRGAKGRFLKGYKHSPETLNKLSKTWFKKGHKTNVGRKCPEYVKRKIAKVLMGRQFTEETIQKMRDAKRGKHISAKHKKALLEGKRRANAQGMPLEIRKKIAQSLLGHPVSDKMREKARQRLLGNKMRLGKYHSDETKKKIMRKRLQQIFPTKDTEIERILQTKLAEKGVSFEKHVPIYSARCQPDIFIKPNICIFADGDYWHNLTNVAEKDKRQNEGYRVLRFWEHEIMGDADKCIQSIINELSHKILSLI